MNEESRASYLAHLERQLDREKETRKMLDHALSQIFVALGLKAISPLAPCLTWQDAVEEIGRLRALTTPGQRVRHVRGGPEYEVIGTADLRTPSAEVCPGAELTIFRAKNGKWLAWTSAEVHDGQFVPAQPAPQGGGSGRG